MSIIAILAGLTLNGMKMANNKGAAARTEALKKMIELALDRYELEYGGYPANITNPMTATDDSAYSTSLINTIEAEEALLLYRVVTGDLNGDGIIATDGTEEPLIEVGFAGQSDKHGYSALIEGKSPGDTDAYALVDGWGNPFRYFHAGSFPPATTIMKNGTYDLWSYGIDEPGVGTPNEARWIKNW